MDLADDASMVNTVDHIIQKEGKIDVLINNAGFGSYGAVEDVPMEDAKYQLEINLFGLVRLTQLVLPHMRSQRFGKIVNVTSIGGKMATPLGGWYHASKFAVEGLSDSLRMEVKPFGIDVIVIEPGGVKTEWQGIANDRMQKVSGHTAYANLTGIGKKMTGEAAKKFSEPLVIAKLIKKVISIKGPKARYSGGHMAGMILFMRKLLSDRMFDKLITSQLK
jgi:short-subunit dehydrogenase